MVSNVWAVRQRGNRLQHTATVIAQIWHYTIFVFDFTSRCRPDRSLFNFTTFAQISYRRLLLAMANRAVDSCAQRIAKVADDLIAYAAWTMTDWVPYSAAETRRLQNIISVNPAFVFSRLPYAEIICFVCNFLIHYLQNMTTTASQVIL